MPLCELGVGDDSTLQSWDTYTCLSEFKGPYNFTEVFRREIGALVTRDSLYRESLYTVVLPSGLPEHESLGALMSTKGVEYGSSDPWDFIRRHILVNHFFFIISVNLFTELFLASFVSL